MTPAGVVTRSSPANLPLLVPKQDLARIADGRRLRGSISLRRPSGDWRYLAVPASGGAVVVARSLDARKESLRRLFKELLFASPLALLLASLAGYGLAAAAAPAGGGDAPPRRRGVGDGARPAPGSLRPRRDLAPRDDAERDARPARGGVRARAAVRRGREPRAAHPLAMLRTELELALRRPRSHDELEAAVRSAAQEADRLSQLAEDLLLIARADQGALPIRSARVRVDELFSTVGERFARRAGERGQDVEAHPTSASVDADPVRIEQALANLVENALAHGAGAIDLFAVERDDIVELHVADAGAGFPDGFLERAFDRFSRADDARSRGGSGLGLSIVALIAQAHGGSVGAANRPEGGADVWLALPRARVAQPAHALI